MKREIGFYSLAGVIVSVLVFLAGGLRGYAAETTDIYVVEAENSRAFRQIADKYEEKISDSEEYLEDNNFLILELTQAEAAALEQKKGVEYVEEDIVFEGCDEQVEAQDISQWNLKAINRGAEQMGSDNIKIALVDSGVSYSDDIDVAERVCFVPGEEEVSELYEDGSGHGTAMAGMIAAKDNDMGITGIVPEAALYSLRVLNSENKCTLSRLLSAVYWAIDNQMDIINLSLGTSVDSEILHQALAEAYREGSLVIAAAGNNAASGVLYPAAYGEVMAVGASDASGELAEEYASGEELDILAPGMQVPATGLMDGVIITDGTSISAAQVTGAAALLWSRDGGKSPGFIRDLLKISAKSVGTASAYGVGLLDIGYALQMYDGFASAYTEEGETEVPENPGRPEDYSDEALASGLWSADDHGGLAEELANNTFVKKDVELIAESAKRADTVYGTSLPKACPALHGGGNYVVNLKYLFYMAQYSKDGKKDITTADTDAAAKLPYIANADDREKLEKLRASTKELLQTNIKANYGESGGTQRYCKVLGFAMHLIGDTYAHRAVVPAYTVAGANPAEAIYSSSDTAKACRFGTGNFKVDSSHSKSDDATLKAWARASSTAAICKYWNCFQRTVGLGVMEFRDIKYFMKSKSAKIYEDEPTFCHERYADTKRACKSFMNKSYQGNAYTCRIFWSQYGNKLNYYKGYSTEAGSKVTNYTDTEWNAVSTTTKI